MKSFIISIVLAFLIIVGGIFHENYLENFSDDLIALNQEIQSLVSEKNFTEAEEKENSLINFWNKNKTVIASTLNHENIDNIETNIAELFAYTKAEKIYETLAKCETLNVLFKHLSDSYTFKAENVL